MDDIDWSRIFKVAGGMIGMTGVTVGLLWLSRVLEVFAARIPRRRIQRRSLRIQKFMLRGRYVSGGRGSSLTRPLRIPFLDLWRLLVIAMGVYALFVGSWEIIKILRGS